MKKVILVFALIFMISGLYAAPILDGVIDAGEGWIVGAANSDSTDLDGADLDTFYYYISQDSLYFAVKTQNRASWDVAYGFAIDVDQTDSSGYIGDPGAGIWDSWGRHIVFANEPPDYFAPDYQVYFWYDQASGITSVNFNRYNGVGWDYSIAPVEYAYTWDTLGLHVLEFRIGLDSLEYPGCVHIVSYITGGDNSSCVDVLPYDSTVNLHSGGAEWTDTDTLHYFVDILITGIENRSQRPRVLTPVLNGVKIEGNGMYTLEVYSLDGRKVHEETLKVNGNKVVKFNLPPGMYLVLDREAGVSKFIVIK
ncbi:MAG TPA: T9SS type A sorting domain-containing protein [candidate division WOR-3 bacterium]|uniref:T9SS type A sorting domain-containing protein n=1 Tax=candidate division WOR-3 bacterium TaxID=2052148 RepID=A0A7V5LUE1_UNCW3|nr:T9SS type A sorting domain-containing protein [candidate division WOR-3 bacterium]